MFKGGDNWVGVALLALCGVVGGALVWQIVTGNRFTYDGPRWLGWVLAAIFIGGIAWGLLSRYRINRGAPTWPDPASGRKSLWDRLRGR